MDRQVIDQKLESLRRCLVRIQEKFPARADELQTNLDLQMRPSIGKSFTASLASTYKTSLNLPKPSPIGFRQQTPN